MQKCLESRQSHKNCKKNSIISEIKLLEEFCTISIKEIKYSEVWGQCYKTFLVCDLQIFRTKLECFLD